MDDKDRLEVDTNGFVSPETPQKPPEQKDGSFLVRMTGGYVPPKPPLEPGKDEKK